MNTDIGIYSQMSDAIQTIRRSGNREITVELHTDIISALQDDLSFIDVYELEDMPINVIQTQGTTIERNDELARDQMRVRGEDGTTTKTTLVGVEG